VLAALADQGFYLQMPPVPGADAGDGAGQSAVASGAPDSAAASTDREDPSC
jgi:hypothetical protein